MAYIRAYILYMHMVHTNVVQSSYTQTKKRPNASHAETDFGKERTRERKKEKKKERKKKIVLRNP